MIRPKKVASYKGKIQPAQSAAHLFVAPTRGWILSENLASVQPGGAYVLDNWICTEKGIRVRGGGLRHATLPANVVSLFSYGVTNRRMFAATATAVYDVTAPASPLVAPAAAFSGQTSGDYSFAQFGTAGGDFLYIVNGTDSPRLFNGTTWTAITGASSPAITGVTTSLLNHVWVHANRLFFVERNTMRAWYLPVDSIGGIATSFSLAGVFKKGGSLLFGARWSLDAGDGLDDVCVFVSTEGEIAVYEGQNPSDANNWSLSGIYEMPRPLGKNATASAGGELLVATTSGIIPISAAIKSDLGALERQSITYAIYPYWRKNFTTGTVHIEKVPSSGVMFVTEPGQKYTLAANLLTGAWSRLTWQATCLLDFEERGYFGAGSRVFLMDAGGNDDGMPYTAVYVGQFEGLGSFGGTKTAHQMRATFETSGPINPQITARADFDTVVSSPPASPANYTVDVWDVGLWDQAKWDATGGVIVQSVWTAVGVTGRVIAPEVQLTFGIVPTPNVSLVAIEAEYQAGARVT
jgi:hypothetical protein